MIMIEQTIVLVIKGRNVVAKIRIWGQNYAHIALKACRRSCILMS